MNNQPLSTETAQAAKEKINLLKKSLHQVLFGQEALIDLIIIGILSRGHILLEGLPGLGKTAIVKGLSTALGLDSQRVQFTPDLLPGDITGNPLLQEKGGERQFVFQPGPLFANIVLADEINRASPKTQSALLQGMQEGIVTVMGETHSLPEPFFVIATQNPIELEGTYPLPEAQLDRFLFKIFIDRNPVEVLEKIILNRDIGQDPQVEPVLDKSQLVELISSARAIYLPEVVANYIARLVNATHPGESEASATTKYGASPRAALALAAAAKARALTEGRTNASFEDVQAVAASVLEHRIQLAYQARLAGTTCKDVVRALLAEVPVQPSQKPSTLQAAKIK